jgi:23S rRNA (cytosine1962-C5)-methyltransferase
MSEVRITRKGQQRLDTGHLWIYRSDLIPESIAPGREPEPGSIVRVIGTKGQFLGQAFYSTRSQIALRMITDQNIPINRDFWRARLQRAAELRSRLVSDADAFRLIHGEGDLIPSLVIDRYNDSFVIQMLSQGTDALRATWVDLLEELYKPSVIIERDDVKVRALEGLAEQVAVLSGTPPDQLIVKQNDVSFYVDLLSGQKTGLFLDQRENHSATHQYARGRALDCFTFTGAFALHLARSAESVLALDISDGAINQARRNAELNGVSNINFEVANIFDRLKAMDERHEQFDTIVLDPPAFAKNRAAVEAAVRGYKEINLRSIKLLRPDGILITCTCSFNVGEDLFLGILQSAAADAGRYLQLLEKRTQSRDHPILISMPETYYLKCMILRVV